MCVRHEQSVIIKTYPHWHLATSSSRESISCSAKSTPGTKSEEEPHFQIRFVAMNSPFVLFFCLSTLLSTVIGFHGNSRNVFRGRSSSKVSMSFIDDLVSVKSKVLSKFGGPIGFYALMLAPIYGIGLPFFGSMTDFETLQNRGSPGVIANEYIVAPSSFTPARTNYPPYFDVSAADLEKAFDTVALRQPRISVIATDEITHRREYVQRALIFRWPDVITFQPIPLGESKSTLAVHSYSIYGAGDLGVNEARVKSWLAEVEVELAKK